MTDHAADPDEVAILRQLLSAHRSMVVGALHANHEVDIESAFEVHAAISKILTHWDDFSVHEQREIVSTIQYVVNTDDDEPDLLSGRGFQDDLQRLRRLQTFLGYC